MPFTAARVRRRTRAACQRCREHTLCFACFRAERERQRGRTPADEAVRGLPFLRPGHAVAAGVRGVRPHAAAHATEADEAHVLVDAGAPPMRAPAPAASGRTGAAADDRRLAHRRLMLAHLERQRARPTGT